MTRQNRAEQLSQVPLDNVKLVRRYIEELKKSLPQQFLMNPLDDVADLLLEKGLPFEVIDSSSLEDDITWDPDNALFGYDKPDIEKPTVDEIAKKDLSPTVDLLPDSESIE